VNGNLSISTDYELKTQEIRSIVETRFFERVMRADYGVGDHTLDVMDPGQINSEFQSSIQAYVSGLTSLVVRGDWVTSGEDGIYKVNIVYQLNGVPQPPLEFSLSN
jgi:phage baseplate assembly protein W